MRLPGTRYQEPGWEEVRKLLGQCSLAVLRADASSPAPAASGDGGVDGGVDAGVDAYVEGMASALQAHRRSPRAAAPGNSYGDTVFELALTLVYELQARRADWLALCAALPADARDAWRAPGQEALLRKKVNDMYAVLRDKVDADNYQAACGRPCSPNRIYAYRMLDTAYGDIARLFGNWRQHRAQVGAILERDLGADGDAAGTDATPIEVRQLRGIADCRPEWILRWSAAQEMFGAGPGPLHTRSKRFANLKTSPDKIGAMLREIGEYETLSANRDRDWVRDVDDAALWMDDYWRVLQESQDAATPGPDRILEARQDALDDAAPDEDDEDDEDDDDDDDGAGAGVVDDNAAPDPRWPALATAVSLPPYYMRVAAGAEARHGWVARVLAADGFVVRLAVYARLLGPDDDAYPDEWRDPASGALPTMQQLAGLAALSLPTLRKRRDAAIARLEAYESADNAGTKEAAR